MKKGIFAIIICMFMTFSMVSSAKAAEQISIYTDDGNADYLVEVLTEGEKSAEALVDKLVFYKAVPDGSKVNSFETVDEDGKKIGKLDMNQVYGDAVLHTGTAGEHIYIYSVVNTLIKNLNLEGVYLTVEGEEYATGHSIYDYNLEFDDHVINAGDATNTTVTIVPEPEVTDAPEDDSSTTEEPSLSSEDDKEESTETEPTEEVKIEQEEDDDSMKASEKESKGGLWKIIIVAAAIVVVISSISICVTKKKKCK